MNEDTIRSRKKLSNLKRKTKRVNLPIKRKVFQSLCISTSYFQKYTLIKKFKPKWLFVNLGLIIQSKI